MYKEYNLLKQLEKSIRFSLSFDIFSLFSLYFIIIYDDLFSQKLINQKI